MAIERIVPNTIEWEAYYANHIFRYAFAKKVLPSARPLHILDAACGVGYGSHFLAQDKQWKIVGIDQSKEALTIAHTAFSQSNIRYVVDDCHTLEQSKVFGPFDAILSFETVEHLERPIEFIQNCYSLLRDEGMLILSTPNQLVTSPSGKRHWKYHEKEYSPSELMELVSNEKFKEIRLFGQQFTAIGEIRNQRRNEYHRLYKRNLFLRAIRKIKFMISRKKNRVHLAEQIEDFECKEYNSIKAIEELGKQGPFVLMVVCKK